MNTVEQQQHFQLLAQAQRLLGRILCAAGQYRKAEEYFELALQTSHEYGMRLEYARALSSLGEALLLQSCPTEARYQQGVSDLEEASSTFARHHATIELERVNRILPKNLHTFPGT
jgi:tetratricopeptide (TPR) repeat protein